MIDNCMGIGTVCRVAVGAYGGTPGRNALRPYGISAMCRKIGMFFHPGIFVSIIDQLHGLDFSTSRGRITTG